MKNKKIVVAGYVSLDMTPEFPNAGRGSNKASLSDIIRPGKMVNVERLAMSTGGCVSNTGGALHFFGADATIICKIGDDAFGEIIERMYRERGYNVAFIKEPGADTSYTLVISPPGCDRFFMGYPGANGTFTASELDYSMIGQAGWLHFGYPSVMAGFYSDGGSSLAEMFKKAKSMGLATSMDTCAIDPEGEAAKCDWKAILAKALPYVDYFVPSIEELLFILDKKKHDELQARAAGGDVCRCLSLSQDVIPAAEAALKLGCGAVLLKCGAAGMYLSAPAQGGFSAFAKSFVPDKMVSGTGAGDVAIAAFICGVTEGLALAECLDLAVAAGTCCLAGYDSLSGLIPIEEMKKKIAAGWEREDVILP